MQTKKKLLASIMALTVLLFTATFSNTAQAGPSDRALPEEDDIFWQVLSVMTSPTDTTACQNKINSMAADGTLEAYINAHRDELMGEGNPQGGDWQGGGPTAAEMAQGFGQMCTSLAQMPTEMQAGMTQDGVTTNLFSAPDWHNVSGLYFQKAGEGKISFTNTIDFLTYRFFRFMSNFDTMVEMVNGYISLNSSMATEFQHYGAQLTMYGLSFSEVPDIYVNGRLATSSDISDTSYDSANGTLTFNASHFSAYRAVAKGSNVKTMVITRLTKKSVKYNARKSTFQVVVKGRNLKPSSGQTAVCTLGFEQATKVHITKKGKKAICTFPMSYFSDKGTFPLTISISGKGEATKANAFTVK